MLTIGVSIAVPDPEGTSLQEYRVALGDESARHIPTHITLVPPTEVADDDLDAVVAHLEAAARGHVPFRVSLRGTGTFRPVSPVVFIGVVEGISGCELLAGSVCSGPLAAEVEFPYHPHVTVAHHLSEEKLDEAFEELSGYRTHFQVSEFWLYVHDEDHGWQPRRSFPLG
ncbi:2'-5' RNA ligase family protein [Marmoricola sp. RAF53]|uniref:2'-5' RNA ligase family protein n=1 Tax=Marmoricola sp. RAF53 TaxID=3233059 RepID=UPI003F94B876